MSKFAVLRIRKINNMGNIGGTESHLKRTRETANADPQKMKLNVSFIDGGLKENLEKRLPEKVRKNAVLAVEHLMTASPEFFKNLSTDKIQTWAKESVNWAKNRYGGQNIISAELHLDESTPHLHLVTVPILKNPKTGKENLNAREIYGGKLKMVNLQDSYSSAMSKLGLERGLKGSKATHTDIKQFYATVNGSNIEKPQKKGLADFGYEKRLEKFVNQNYHLMIKNAVLIRESANLKKNFRLIAHNSVSQEQNKKMEKVIKTSAEITTDRHNLLMKIDSLQKAIEEKNTQLEKSEKALKQKELERKDEEKQKDRYGNCIHQFCNYLSQKVEPWKGHSIDEVYKDLVKKTNNLLQESQKSEQEKRPKAEPRQEEQGMSLGW